MVDNGYKQMIAELRAKIRASKGKIERRKNSALRLYQEAYEEEFLLSHYERQLRELLE